MGRKSRFHYVVFRLCLFAVGSVSESIQGSWDKYTLSIGKPEPQLDRDTVLGIVCHCGGVGVRLAGLLAIEGSASRVTVILEKKVDSRVEWI